MDSCEFLTHLYNAEPRAVHTLLGNYYKGEETKCAFLVHIFCKHLMNRNLWVLKHVHNMILEVEKRQNKKEKVEGTLNLLNLLRRQKQHHYNIDIGGVPKNEIDQLLYFFNYEKNESHAYDTLVQDELSLFEMCVRSEKISDAITILQYLLGLKDNQVFAKPGGENDIVWVIFDILMTLTPKHALRDFVGYSRDLYFYKLKSKQRIERLPVIFVCTLAIAQGNVKYKPVNLPLQDVRMSYLYVYTEVDDSVTEKVEMDRHRKSNRKHPCRSLQVASKDYERLEKLRNTLSIIKSN